MAVEKKIGHGTQLKRGGTSISQLKNITPFSLSREEVEATTLDSSVEETLPSDPPSVGEVSADQVWTSGEANHELIDTDFQNRTITTWSIVFNGWSTPRTATFSAWVKSISPEQIDGKNTYRRTVVWKLTSYPSWS